MNEAYLLLGANLGNPTQQLQAARSEIMAHIGPTIRLSNLYKTAAWGVVDQPDFLNQVILVQTALDVRSLLHACQKIENILGRIRETKWGARIIDIDILYFNADIIQEEDLIIPHPFISKRNFTLVPLAEIAPNYVNPNLNYTNAELLTQSNDTSLVQLVHE